jgi:Helix-turn-helix domain
VGVFEPLSSDAKCNTPRRFDIGKVVQDLKECCHAILFASLGRRRDQIAILRAAGRSMGAIARALGRAKTTISRELQRNALSSGGYSPLHAAGAYQLRRRREAILERDAALRLFVGDRLAGGWTPEQISGWLKSGNEPRLRAIGCETIYAFIDRIGQKAEAQAILPQYARRSPRYADPILYLKDVSTGDFALGEGAPGNSIRGRSSPVREQAGPYSCARNSLGLPQVCKRQARSH